MTQIGVESENGWRPATLSPGSDQLVWKTVPGTKVTLQVMRGLPEVFLPAWAADWNAYIEPLRDADSASYTETNSVATSNHLNGTAEDLDWENHPFHEESFTADQAATVHQMVDFYEGWMFWAGDWQSPLDQMHTQMGYNTWNRHTAALDFIGRKIRSDGFSTFRRGPLSPADPPHAAADPAAPQPVSDDGADSPTKVLYDAVPVIDMARAGQLVDAMVAGLALAECTNVNRIAMALAQWGEESAGFATTQEYGTGQRYAPYIGRTWGQLTWLSNYQAFGRWAADRGLISDPNQFVNDPESLADMQWADIGAAWFWITPHAGHNLINDDSDAGDVTAVTETINGGDTNLQNRIDRYNQAIALGDRLLLLIAPKGPLMALTDDEQTELLTKTREVWDQLRLLWNMLGGHTPVEAIAEVRDKVCGTSDAGKSGVQ